MIKINSACRELSKVEVYLMTRSKSIISVKDMKDGQTVTPDTWVNFDKVDEETGEISTILSFNDVDSGKIYATQSKTFMNDFVDIVSIMEGERFTLVKCSGVSKNGRSFVYCTLKV